ncbi:MAG: terminase gpA endonuclease subunit [Desulfovibrio sp.]
MAEPARQLEPVTFEFTDGERDVFRLRPFMPPSAWAEANVMVKDGPYKDTRWRNATVPYLPEIMDTWAQPWLEEEVVCGTAQSAKTSAMYRCLEYCVDRRPGPRMLAMPDDLTLSRVSEFKLLPSIKACPATRAKLVKATQDEYTFTDGSVLYLSSAQSPSQRASISVRDMFLDEEDLYKLISGQSDPVSDFRDRTTSFEGMRKLFRVSKPVGGEESSIWNALLACVEIRAYAVVCPACGAEQFMRFAQIKFLGVRDPKAMRQDKVARYECEHCRYHWSDHVRNEAVRRGSWGPVRWDADTRRFMPTSRVYRPRSVGFHLPAYISPFVSLSEIAATFLEAKADPRLWKTFDNGMRAKPHVRTSIKTSWEKILEARVTTLPPRTVPAAAVALTAGFDLQKRGLWFVVRAWADTLESWLVDYGYVPNFEDVRKLCFEALYPVEGGGEKGIWRAGLDTGGGETDDQVWTRTEEAYQWVRACGMGKVFACKGASHAQLQPVKRTPIDRLPRSGRPIPGGLVLHILDTDYFKRLIHARLEPDAPQPFRLHSEADEEYAKQLSAEELVTSKGKQIWRQTRRDNHLLDCEMLAAACAAPEWTPGLQLLAKGIWGNQPSGMHHPPSASHTTRPGSRPVPAAIARRRG